MDNQHLTKYTPQKMANQYYILDTTVPVDQTAVVAAMNGRQGDNLRSIPIAFTDDGQPHDLTNTDITLKVLDAQGSVKVSNKVLRLVDATGGLVLFGVPSEVYANPGEVQRAYFVLTDKTQDGESQVISTINVDFTVIANGIDITKEDHSTYISKIDSLLSSTDSLATLNTDNKFTGANSFKSIHVDSLTAPALDSLASATASVADGITSAAANVTATSSAVSSQVTSLSENISGVTSSVNALSTTASANASSLSSLSSVVAGLPTSSAGNNYSDAIASLESTIADLSETVDDQGSSLETASTAASTASSVAAQASYQASQASNAVWTASSMASQAMDSANNALNRANAASDSVTSLVTALKMQSINV